MNKHADQRSMPPEGRKALFGAWFGFFVDMFDIYLPVLALAPASVYFESPDIPPATSAIISAMVFTATLIGRPLGALLFGYLADTLGRKRTAILSVTGFGTVTAIIALLPGYETLGIAAVWILIFLRFLDGIFLGGEYTSATPLALEYSPRPRRGHTGGVIMTGYPLAYCSVAALTYLVLQWVPAGGLDSPYVQWGWRIPFAVGAVLALVFVVWFTRNVDESESWREAKRTERPASPLAELLSGRNLRSFLQVFVLMSGLWINLNMLSSELPRLLKASVGLDDSTVSLISVITYAVLALGYYAGGAVSQYTGRRPYLIGSGLLTALVVPVGYGVIVSGVIGNVAVLTIVVIVTSLMALSLWGTVTPYINERFHTGVRASGYGLGYSLAVIIPSFYAFYQSGLSTVMPSEYTPLVLLVVAGTLIAIAAAVGPETRDVDFSAAKEGRQ